MKKTLCAVLCAVLLLGMVSSPASAVGVTDVMIVANCSEWVSLREQPDTASKRLKTVRLGEFVLDCTMATNGFVYCNYDGTWGYILFQYLQPTSYSPSEGFIGNQMVVNCTDWVSMRVNPDDTSTRVAQVPLGTVVTGCLNYYSGQYVYCQYNGKSGYINSAYLRSAYYSALKRDDKVVSAAAEKYPAIVGKMQVVNCSQWVSLREKASSASSRITKVNLGEWVDQCVQVSDTFIYCRYKTLYGYIQIQYLQGQQAAPTATPWVITPPPTMAPTAQPITAPESVFAELTLPSYALLSQVGEATAEVTSAAGYTVLVRRAYGQKEELLAVCYDPQRKPLWQATVMGGEGSKGELQPAAFQAGTAVSPQIVLFSVNTGFTAYSVGPAKSVLWQMPNSVVQAGSSLCAFTDANGQIYLAFDGHLMALSAAGQPLWRMEYQDARLYRPLKMDLRNGNLEVYYDTDAEHKDLCWMAIFNRSGQLLNVASAEKP